MTRQLLKVIAKDKHTFGTELQANANLASDDDAKAVSYSIRSNYEKLEASNSKADAMRDRRVTREMTFLGDL